MRFVNFLRNSVVVFASMIIGILLGYFFPNFSKKLGEIGDLYLLLVEMTVIPILLSAIISSLGRFVENKSLRKLAPYAFLVVFTLMIFTVVVSLFVGFVISPGELPPKESHVLSEYIGDEANVLEFNLNDSSDNATEQENAVLRFIKIIVPKNIFSSLVYGNALEIAFISIVIGIAAGLLQKPKQERRKNEKETFILFFENLFQIFQSVIVWVLTILPFGLICIISSQVASVGLVILTATTKLIFSFYVVAFVLLLSNSFMVSFFTKKNPWSVFSASLYPTLVGFTTKSSVATIPFSIQALESKLNVNSTFSRLFVPLCTILGRYGNLAYFGIVGVFAAELYDVDLMGLEIIILAVGLLFSSIATSGASGFATLSAISIAFIPLGIPVETILLILYAIDPIIDPMRTAVIVNTNFCTTSIIYAKKSTIIHSDDTLFLKDT